MQQNKFGITIHMVASLDGFIAKKDNSIEWFETAHPYENGVDGEDPEIFLKTIDCYVMGARTYELALELSKTYGWAYGDTPTIVVTHCLLPVERDNIAFYAGELRALVEEQLKPKYNRVWVVGGSALVNDFLRQKLADEIRISFLPILLGEGLPFFDPAGLEQCLHLKNAKAYKTGMVELHYEILK